MLGYDTEEREYTEGDMDVSKYAKGAFEYPCFVVSPPFEGYKVTVLQQMIKHATPSAGGKEVNLYFQADGKTVGLGKLFPSQVSSFLKLFDGNKIKGYYEDGTELEGDMLYVLC